ncbi:plasmid partitioning protein RepB C-terminal domain-containing protein [Paracoccus saliphilus]|uniref:ParB N-terminal domain-containing protein n=1 Tax=Paracoccus saliphilus TaxID=405559 RepID=A0AA45W6Z9_9RHOB|nr:plasmid partitioning protein RepB C-terminal domain-containing protein [Paracoccus saliphilus]WCR03947.1 ParB N-terminal domain-containing protein [Paracoccus saliphilus]SIT05950.1 ParB-like nuclease domain-containing protein [Paracoccus saliphilus]
MTRKQSAPQVKIGFEETSLRISIDAILPLHEISERVRKSVKYSQIAASIAEVGIIEPPVIVRDRDDRDRFHLLDGHLRIDILKNRGEAEVVCLIALDDEAFTYNKRVSRIAIIQEHKMILNAIRKGVSEERLARALNVNIANIRMKRNLLVGICPEAAELLRDKHVPITVFTELRYLKPMRQIEAAQSMITMNRYSTGYARSLVASTPEDQLVEGRERRPRGLTEEQIAVMQRESENLDREFKLVEQSYGADQLDLVQAVGYVNHLLGNARIVRHLAQHHADILTELQKIVDMLEAA